MKILVINLDSATTRMAFQKEQLTQLGLEYERLPAVQIKDKSNENFVKYHASWQRPLGMAEVACFISHKLAWDQVIAADLPMLILEDDALLSDNVPSLLNELDKLKDVDYVNLEARGINKKKQLAKKSTYSFTECEMYRLYQGRSGAAGYVIWPSGAKKLLVKMQNEGIALSDKFINSAYNLLAYQIEPAVIIQLDQCQQHGIAQPIEVKTSLGSRPEPAPFTSGIFWRHTLKRIVGQIEIGFNQMQNSHRATRRNIAISGLFKKD